MTERIPKNEYEVSYLHLIFFILLIILLLLISFFIGYKTGEKRVCKSKVTVKEKINTKQNKVEKKIKPQLNKTLKTEKKPENITDKTTVAQNPTPEKVKEMKPPIKKEIKKVEKTKKEEIQKPKYKKGYYVQVAATQDLVTAKKDAKKYRKHFKVIIFYPKESDQKKWYKLRTGPFKTKAQAKNYLLKLKNRYKIKGFIVKVE